MSPERRPRRLNYANVTATFALVVSLSTGGAYAAGKIGSNGIADNAIKSRHIANGQVTSGDLKANAVKGGKVKNGSLSGKDLAPRSTGVALAGVTINGGSGAVNQSFNRLGAPITASRSATGSYSVTIPGADFSSWTNTLYSLNGSLGGYCFLNQAIGEVADIRCRDFSEAADDPFTVEFVVFKDVPDLARPAGPPQSAIELAGAGE
jgi:hypothetical protein